MNTTLYYYEYFGMEGQSLEMKRDHMSMRRLEREVAEIKGTISGKVSTVTCRGT